uniref:Uncharacterized protein n=1 Tax=Mycobacterium riyadhense TaxID=486698 RepID=A0A653F485_9MYCO|nr:hypothetical protein BIN_B_05506 [Mycobacterium riyadhense]
MGNTAAVSERAGRFAVVTSTDALVHPCATRLPNELPSAHGSVKTGGVDGHDMVHAIVASIRAAT